MRTCQELSFLLGAERAEEVARSAGGVCRLGWVYWEGVQVQPLPPPLRGYSLTLRAREMNNLLGAERAGEVARSAGGVCRLGTEPSATTPSPAPRVLPHAFRAREKVQPLPPPPPAVLPHAARKGDETISLARNAPGRCAILFRFCTGNDSELASISVFCLNKGQEY